MAHSLWPSALTRPSSAMTLILALLLSAAQHGWGDVIEQHTFGTQHTDSYGPYGSNMNNITQQTGVERNYEHSPEKASPRIGFQSLPGNFSVTIPRLGGARGDVPKWLNGSLYRNGGVWWNADLSHWFLGLSMVHIFTFDSGKVSLSSRYTNSSVYQEYLHPAPPRRTKDHSPSLKAEDHDSVDAPLQHDAAVELTQSSNTNSGFMKIGQHLVSNAGETSFNEINPVTGDTIQAPFQFEDTVVPAAQSAPSHSHTDPKGNIVHYFYVYGATPGYQLYHIPAGTTKRILLGDVIPARPEMKVPFYMDSFGLTENYIVLSEVPALVLSNFTGEFVEQLGTRWHVLDRTNGSQVTTFDSPAFFYYHHINAYEDRDAQGREEIIVDIQTYPNMDSLPTMSMSSLLNHTTEFTHAFNKGGPERFRLPLWNPGSQVVGVKLWRYSLEIPTIAYEHFNTQKYRFIYGVSAMEGKSLYLDRLVKLDLETPSPHGKGFESVEWTGEGLYPGEPIFVSNHPRSKGPKPPVEDSGAVLSVVLDAYAEHSFLLILDATSFVEIASVPLKFTIPFGFHGAFFHNGSFPTALQAPRRV